MKVLGLDIGGANLKSAHSSGAARLMSFALWKEPAALPERLRRLVDGMPAWDTLAVTMTGELCDCFETKRAGVSAILDAVHELADENRIRVWTNQGRLVDVAAARTEPLAVASANWRALAQFAMSLAGAGPGLLLDVGSTTTDVVPWEHGTLRPRGLTDPDRLREGGLVYLGVKRTPLCALLGVHHAAEFFATTGDLFLALEFAAEQPEECDTADGRPATRAAAAARLARMLCADAESCSSEDLSGLTHRLLQKVVSTIRTAVECVVEKMSAPPATVVLAGSGEFLLQRFFQELCPIPRARPLSLAGHLGPRISACACAYALTQLLVRDPGT
jgi:(4-(4-[2-(gamma-L-glutamylamino)ethyl]phenoxymethyl)furan-2-yl)methanamine synthase